MNVQEEKWKSEFGNAYTNRNPKTVEDMDELHLKNKGMTRTMFTKTFLDGLEIKNTLEVGCNVGVALQMLNRLGYKQLYGIEVNQKAIDIAKESTKGTDIYVINGSAQDIPFKDGFFDMVFCNGLLIHISPNDIDQVIDEMYRCTRRYIWGYEYFSDKIRNIVYRGEDNLLWANKFSVLFTTRFHDLKLVKHEIIRYIKHPDLMDVMFLLEKVR